MLNLKRLKEENKMVFQKEEVHLIKI